MKKTITLVVAAVITISTMSFELMSDNGRAGVTGSPNEGTCNQSGCHSAFPINSGGGSVVITAPTLTNWQYVPGQTYAISVTVAKAGASLFGLGFEALTGAGANAGTLTAGTGTKTLLSPGGTNRTNIVHTGTGNTGTNTHTFTFNWKAPATNIGNITFYCAGNAANNNGLTTGDYIYTTSQIVTASSVSIQEESFAKQINIFPNPVSDHLQIVNQASPGGRMTVSVMDMKGSHTHQRQDITSQDVIDVNGLKAGAYLLKVETAGKIAVKQFIKQ